MHVCACLHLTCVRCVKASRRKSSHCAQRSETQVAVLSLYGSVNMSTESTTSEDRLNSQSRCFKKVVVVDDVVDDNDDDDAAGSMRKEAHARRHAASRGRVYACSENVSSAENFVPLALVRFSSG